MSICCARASEDAGERTRVHLRDCIARVTRKKRGDARSHQGKPSKCRGSCIQQAYRAKDTRGRSIPRSLLSPLALSLCSSLLSLCVTIAGHRSAIASTRCLVTRENESLPLLRTSRGFSLKSSRLIGSYLSD